MERKDIKKLNKITAGRISAGEVVENPSGVLRELLDNAIDSGADKISVYLEDGGIKTISVQDNGCGINKEQIHLAFESHATSKIENIEDLYKLKTMGFRGEALYSIASVSRLSISSDGYTVVNDNGKIHDGVPSSVNEGTLVKVEGLFDIIPARKQFLKRPTSEGALCKKIFLEKALGFEKIDFLYYEDGNLEIFLPKGNKLSRALEIMALDKSFNKDYYYEMSTNADTVKMYAVSSTSSYYKRDRSQIKIFINNRVIDSFPLVQVITNSYSESLPGGAFPFFYVFIDLDPSLVDFNIHPAKRECKIRNQNQVTSLLSQMIRNYLMSIGRKNMEIIRSQMTTNKNVDNTIDNNRTSEKSLFYVSEPHKNGNYNTYPRNDSSVYGTSKNLGYSEFKPKSDNWFEKAKEVLKSDLKANDLNLSKDGKFDYKYLGQVFDTFLVVEISDSVLFIDQHAAHERILYEELISNKKNIQNLLVPHRFETDKSTDEFLMNSSFIYQDFGIMIARVQPMVWELLSVPSACKNEEDDIIKYIKSSTGDIEVIKKGIFAVLACHSAIKAGDKIDSFTAKSLLDKVFKLDAMICPHGRNFSYSVSKQQLYMYVGRTL